MSLPPSDYQNWRRAQRERELVFHNRVLSILFNKDGWTKLGKVEENYEVVSHSNCMAAKMDTITEKCTYSFGRLSKLFQYYLCHHCCSVSSFHWICQENHQIGRNQELQV